MDTTFIRPSVLPKLALCGHYRSEPTAGAAAERGTRIDRIFRYLISGALGWHQSTEDPDELRAADWAACSARALAGGAALDATEAGCAITIDVGVGRPIPGTADVVCRSAQWSADLKSGQKRDYAAQQACYALGFMEAEFCDEWVVYLLYCDLETVDVLRFTRESAIEAIQDALALWRSQEIPQPNDYCGWCANRFTCPTRRESLGQWLTPLDIESQPPQVLGDATTDKLVSFILLGRALEDWLEESRRIVKERYDAGQRFPGVKMVAKRGSRKVEPLKLAALCDPVALLHACGPITEKAAKELCPELPEDFISEAPGRVEMHITKPKTSKKIKE